LFGIRHGAIAVALLALCGGKASADRIVLAPSGTTLSENSIKTEVMLGPYKTDYTWLSTSSADGIEMEFSRFESANDPKKRWAAGLQYPLPTLQNLPSFVLGIQDITCTGTQHAAVYLAGSQKIPLSSNQKRFVRRLTLSTGLGSGTIGGAFVSLGAGLPRRVFLDAEIYRRRANFSAGFVTLKNLRVKAECIGGNMYYGASYHFTLK
jgi:hypothetical protein